MWPLLIPAAAGLGLAAAPSDAQAMFIGLKGDPEGQKVAESRITGDTAAEKFLGKLGITPDVSTTIKDYSNYMTPEFVQKLYDQTGWFPGYGTNGLMREISDENASFVRPKETRSFNELSSEYDKMGLKAFKNEDIKYTGKLGDMFKHEELMERYPDLKDVNVLYVPHKLNGTQASFNPNKNAIMISGTNPQEIKDSVLHELQHAVSIKEGWYRNQSMGNTRNQMSRSKDPYERRYYRYLRDPDEVLARDTESRSKLSKEERKATSPYYKRYHMTPDNLREIINK